MNKNKRKFLSGDKNREIQGRIFVFGNISRFNWNVLLKDIPKEYPLKQTTRVHNLDDKVTTFAVINIKSM